MKGLILAAGRGSRMGELTSSQPKCFTELGGRSLLSRQIDALREGGVAELGLVRGYQAAAFTRQLTYFENPRWAETNMVASLACASTWLAEDSCIISYSDIVYGADSVRRLAAAAGDIVIAYDPDWRRLWELRFADPLSDAETFRLSPDGRLIEIGARADHIAEIEGQYMGLLRFTPRGWATVAGLLQSLPDGAGDRLDMTALLQKLLTLDVVIDTVAIAEPWYEVDTESDLRLYDEKFFARARPERKS